MDTSKRSLRGMPLWQLAWCVGLCLLLGPSWLAAQQKNGFDLQSALIPPEQIMRGGPPRDGIPAIQQPRFERPDGSQPWQPNDLMLTYDGAGGSRAFPIGILNWHEIVNLPNQAQPLVITFCRCAAPALDLIRWSTAST